MLAQSKDAAFQVQVCHQRVNSHVSVNRGVAIKSAVGTIKYVGGVWILPTGAVAAGVTRSGNTVTFPNGAKVSARGTRAICTGRHC